MVQKLTYAKGIEMSSKAYTAIQSSNTMSTKNLSHPILGNLEHFASIISNLGRTERSLLNLLVSLKPTGSLEVVKTVDFLAEELGIKKRATQYVIKKLSTHGLITRNSTSGLFSQCVTVISSQHVADFIKKPFVVHPIKKTSVAKRPTQPKPFGYLKNPARFENIQLDMQQALHSSTAYWDFVRKGFKSIGFSAPLTTAVQYRRLSDGARGGPQPNRSRNVRLSHVEFEAAKVAQYAQKEFVEATFRVDSLEHPLLLIDDLDAQALDLLPDACAVLETSPGNYQATLIAPRPLSGKEFLLAEDGLLAMLGGGDKGAKGIRQLRRFPGSINNKPGLTTAFVTRVERVAGRQTLTLNELDELIETGKKIRGFYEWDCKTSAAAEAVSAASGALNAVPEMQSKFEKTLAGTSDQSASGRDFGKAIELIRKGWNDASIIEQIEISAGNRMKNGHPHGHPMHRAYAQGTVSRARSKYKQDAPPNRLNWKRKTPHGSSINQSGPEDQSARHPLNSF
jgi:hypothetical protein